MKNSRICAFALWLLLALSASVASAVPYASMYVFGDSLSDTGNAYILTGGAVPPSPPYSQRFSNGPVAVEHLANSHLGIGLAPSVLGGNNYAVGGATTGNASYIPGMDGTGMLNQLAWFSAAPPAFNPDTTLFFVWGGANDFFFAPSPAAIAPALGNLANTITALTGLGAKHFLVPNLPDLGITPDGRALGAGGSAGLTALSQAFNANLGLTLASLAPLGADIVAFDTYGTLNDVIAHAGDYGFTNVTDQCLGNPACTDPYSYLFWDGVHPTTHADAVLADRFAAAVPEPAGVALMLVGMMALAGVRRKGWRRGARYQLVGP